MLVFKLRVKLGQSLGIYTRIGVATREMRTLWRGVLGAWWVYFTYLYAENAYTSMTTLVEQSLTQATKSILTLITYAENAYNSMNTLVKHSLTQATKSRLTLLTYAENAYNSMNTLVEQSLALATKRRLPLITYYAKNAYNSMTTLAEHSLAKSTKRIILQKMFELDKSLDIFEKQIYCWLSSTSKVII